MLYNEFINNKNKVMTKVAHYFPIYERHFSKFKNQSVVFWEIGVYKGGSLQMWKRYFGPFAKIVGIDINHECLRHEESQISICIGDQSDTVFLQGIIDMHGSPDIVLDDGSHMMEHINTTFDFLYDKLSKNGVYMVEDLCTAYWDSYGGGLKREGTFIERCKDLLDSLNARHVKDNNDSTPMCQFANKTFSMCFYDSVVVFEKTEWNNDTYQSLTIPDICTEKKDLLLYNMHDEFINKSSFINKQVFLFGAGYKGSVICDILKAGNISSLCYVDNDCSKVGSYINGTRVITPEESLNSPEGKYILSVYDKKAQLSIRQQLNSMGIEDKDIFSVELCDY